MIEKGGGEMVRQDFLFITLLVIALYFVRRETGHWKH
jgi:hypothetical protein